MIANYIEFLTKNRRLSAKTIANYERELHTFATWAQPKGARWSTIDQGMLEEYLRERYDIGDAGRTIRTRITALRGLFRYFQNHGLRTDNPARFIESPKVAQLLPQVLDESKLRKQMNSTSTDPGTITANALAALILDTGVRLQEALNIKIEDINNAESSIRILGKGSKERIVYFSDLTRQFCALTANKRQGYLIDTDSQVTARYAIYKNFGWEVHPHALRHCYATRLLKNGCDLKTISHLLGHSSIRTTEIYAKVTNAAAQASYERYS